MLKALLKSGSTTYPDGAGTNKMEASKAFSFRKGCQDLWEGAVLSNQQLDNLSWIPSDSKCSHSEEKNTSNFSIGLFSIGQKMKHTMLLKLFNWEIIPILKEIKPSIVMFLQPVVFQAGKGKQRSERSAKNRWLKMLFNNIWLLLSEMSLISPQEKQTLYTIEDTPFVFTSERDPNSDLCIHAT